MKKREKVGRDSGRKANWQISSSVYCGSKMEKSKILESSVKAHQRVTLRRKRKIQT
ncbi:hypothetical protein PJE062_4032 [Pseudovibrio sp. JE062]|nr:hypothetical protein PJE062_4032 [Pseudovibrio sp. JE062]